MTSSLVGSEMCIRDRFNEVAIRTEMKLEGHIRDHIDTVVAMVLAQTPLVQDYIRGALLADPPGRDGGGGEGASVAADATATLRWSPAQRRFKSRVEAA
eukprot:5161152-Prorocentrum_lima.AAC.1